MHANLRPSVFRPGTHLLTLEVSWISCHRSKTPSFMPETIHTISFQLESFAPRPIRVTRIVALSQLWDVSDPKGDSTSVAIARCLAYASQLTFILTGVLQNLVLDCHRLRPTLPFLPHGLLRLAPPGRTSSENGLYCLEVATAPRRSDTQGLPGASVCTPSHILLLLFLFLLSFFLATLLATTPLVAPGG